VFSADESLALPSLESTSDMHSSVPKLCFALFSLHQIGRDGGHALQKLGMMVSLEAHEAHLSLPLLMCMPINKSTQNNKKIDKLDVYPLVKPCKS
jgi:hypothetical protein